MSGTAVESVDAVTCPAVMQNWIQSVLQEFNGDTRPMKVLVEYRGCRSTGPWANRI